jgi:hypothetical protein
VQPGERGDQGAADGHPDGIEARDSDGSAQDESRGRGGRR